MVGPARIDVRRHFQDMSVKDEDAVVQAVAELVVSYLKRDPARNRPARSNSRDQNRLACTPVHGKESQT